MTAEILVAAIRAAQDAHRKLPGTDINQLFFLFAEGFKRGSSVVLGGSRVRSYFTGEKKHREAGEDPEQPGASDLDVGFGGLDGEDVRTNATKAMGICKKAQELKEASKPIPIEQSIGIVPGGQFPDKPIVTPEEFFHRTGTRPATDPKSKTEPIAQPSGSITYSPDGTITENKPDVLPGQVMICPSGSKAPPKGGSSSSRLGH